VKILDLVHVAPKLGEGGDVMDIYRANDWLGVPLGEAAEPADLGQFLRKTAERQKESISMAESPTCSPIQEVHIGLSTLPWAIREAWKKAVTHRRHNRG
jgi:hypothetical protein